MAEKEEGFEVVDKRRVNAEAAGQAGDPAPEEPAGREESAAPEEAAGGPAAAAAEEGAQPAEGAGPEEPADEEEEIPGGMPPDVDVYALLSSMIGVLHAFAWQKMGFIADRQTGQVETDLPQARVAIDTVQFLVGKLESQLSEPEVRELRRLVMDLQMNFMRKNSGS